MNQILKFKKRFIKSCIFGRHNNTGFTLIELLIAITIFIVVSLGLVALVSSMLVSSNKQSNLIADSDQARKLSGNIINELRNAEVSSTGAFPLATADNQTLMFYSNIDTDSYIERIRYYSQNGKLYKGVLKPTGNPLVYNPANERSFEVQNNLANGVNPIFYYYDGAYDGSTGTNLAQPVNVTVVKYVKLDLRVFNKAGVMNNNYYTVTASGSFRNLKENLADPGLPDYFYNLTTSVSPPGVGSVAVSPVGPSYEEQTLVNLTAYANVGYLFSSWTGDVNNATSATSTIVMSENKSVTANFNAIAQTLTGSVSSKNGSQNSRRWTLRINNPNGYTVNGVNLYSFSIARTSGTVCSPTVTLPADFPVLVGNIGAGSNRTYQVTINFSGCDNSSRFTATFTYAGNNGANWGSTTVNNQQY